MTDNALIRIMCPNLSCQRVLVVPEAARGKVVYRNNCTACHAPDPNQEGGLGPSVAGSSLELLTAKVLLSEYPEGYTPKRDSRVMVALPFLEPELPALHAYLEAAAAPGS